EGLDVDGDRQHVNPAGGERVPDVADHGGVGEQDAGAAPLLGAAATPPEQARQRPSLPSPPGSDLTRVALDGFVPDGLGTLLQHPGRSYRTTPTLCHRQSPEWQAVPMPKADDGSST